MRKIIINQTNNLLKTAKYIARRENIDSIPYPNNHFKNNKELSNYLISLTNFVQNPELYYLVRKSIESEKVNRVNKLSNSYFKFIV